MTSRLIAIVVAWLVGLLGVSSPAVAVSLDAPVAACAYNAPASSAEITGSATECGPPTVTYDDTASRVAIHVATDGHWARPLLVSTLTYSAYDHTGQFAQVTGGPGTTRTVLVGREVDTRVVQGTRGAAKSADDVVDLGKGWRATSFGDDTASFEYHFSKHGVTAGVTRQQYADDALQWARNPAGTGKPVQLKDGTEGLRFRTPGGGPGGILDNDGNIITYWYR